MVNKSNPYIAFNYPSDELCWFSSSAWMVEALEAEAGLKEFLGLKARPLLCKYAYASAGGGFKDLYSQSA